MVAYFVKNISKSYSEHQNFRASEQILFSFVGNASHVAKILIPAKVRIFWL